MKWNWLVHTVHIPQRRHNYLDIFTDAARWLEFDNAGHKGFNTDPAPQKSGPNPQCPAELQHPVAQGCKGLHKSVD